MLRRDVPTPSRGPSLGSRPSAASQVTLLPEPDSPTMPTRFAGRDLEARRLSTAREACVPPFAKSTVRAAHRNEGRRHRAGPQMLAKLVLRNSIAKDGEAFHLMSRRLAVKVAFWCSTV
jgi:hypothetical protein